jgi:hypothetical protein
MKIFFDNIPFFPVSFEELEFQTIQNTRIDNFVFLQLLYRFTSTGATKERL